MSAGVGAEALDGPLPVGIAVFVELYPVGACGALGCGRDVDEDWALVGGVDDLVAGRAALVAPFEFEL